MNSRFLLHLIVYLLLGATTMADPGMHLRLRLGHAVAHDIAHGVKHVIVDNDSEIDYDLNKLNRKHQRLKLKFRAENAFRNEHNDIGTLLQTTLPVHEAVSPSGTSIHLPPFYYLFLFRLTPF